MRGGGRPPAECCGGSDGDGERAEYAVHRVPRWVMRPEGRREGFGARQIAGSASAEEAREGDRHDGQQNAASRPSGVTDDVPVAGAQDGSARHAGVRRRTGCRSSTARRSSTSGSAGVGGHRGRGACGLRDHWRLLGRTRRRAGVGPPAADRWAPCPGASSGRGRGRRGARGSVAFFLPRLASSARVETSVVSSTAGLCELGASGPSGQVGSSSGGLGWPVVVEGDEGGELLLRPPANRLEVNRWQRPVQQHGLTGVHLADRVGRREVDALLGSGHAAAAAPRPPPNTLGTSLDVDIRVTYSEPSSPVR